MLPVTYRQVPAVDRAAVRRLYGRHRQQYVQQLRRRR